MQEVDLNECYFNRAVPVRDSLDQPVFQDMTGYACCAERLAFTLADEHHMFQIGLGTILSCLAAAQAEGYVPPLPQNWWNAIQNMG